MSTHRNDEPGHSLSELFEMLSHAYRRRILTAVGRANPHDEDDLPSETSPGEDDEAALALLRQQLYHVHLPKLDDAGFIDWNRETGIIRRGPRFEEIEPLLRLMNEHRDELPVNWP